MDRYIQYLRACYEQMFEVTIILFWGYSSSCSYIHVTCFSCISYCKTSGFAHYIPQPHLSLAIAKSESLSGSWWHEPLPNIPLLPNKVEKGARPTVGSQQVGHSNCSAFWLFWKTFSGVLKEDLFYFFKNKFFKIFIFSYTFYLIVLYLADITSRAI